MERKRVTDPRRYRHLCPDNGNSEQQIPEEICPDCGQRGGFFGWFQGMWNRIGKKSRLLGFPCNGPQMTFLPTVTRSCGRCEGEGILAGDDFDYQCPECEGNGRFLSRTEEEMRKIRRWALVRHELGAPDSEVGACVDNASNILYFESVQPRLHRGC